MKLGTLIFVGVPILAHICAADLQDELDARIRSYVDNVVQTEGCGIEQQLLRMQTSNSELFCPEILSDQILDLIERPDGIDFNMAALSWLMNQFYDHPFLDVGSLREQIVYGLTHVPFWLSDEGDLGPMQFWSENHQIGWKAAQYLIGHAFETNPELSDKIFVPSGMKGSQLKQRGKAKVLEWLDYRSRFGFSEFNSDTYGPIAYVALLSLSGLAPDEDVRTKAQMIQIIQEFDHILGSRQDSITTGRGRAYTEGKIIQRPYNHLCILKGLETVCDRSRQSDLYALNHLFGYRTPTALLQIAQDIDHGDFVLKEQFGLHSSEGEIEGIGVEDPEDCIFWFGDGAYFSRETARCMFVVGDSYNLWNRSETWETVGLFKPLWDLDPYIIDYAAEVGAPLGSGSVLGNVNMYTYRTPDFMMSSVQDYNKGFMAGQQHPWQATLDLARNGTIFSHQAIGQKSSDDHNSKYWVGGILPSPGECEEYRDLVAPGIQNVWICEVGSKAMNNSFDDFKYKLKASTVEASFYYDDSLIECLVDNGCLSSITDFLNCTTTICDPFRNTDQTCARGLSSIPASLGNIQIQELLGYDLANLASNLEMIQCRHDKRANIEVTYTRGDGRVMELGWNSSLTVDGWRIPTEPFPRYDNDFTQVQWGDKLIQIEDGGFEIDLDFDLWTLSYD
ncbi:hypothetical protein TCAL_02356 [Tigriopus californicus]|uniref:Uncharacterized protein n=1 Tax=Tigriopus californicus TaxID=6832 RepID=A0A553NWW3_TIGCA|nr:hypothetical protein TCAL_02356 [Tigriopus californicus]